MRGDDRASAGAGQELSSGGAPGRRDGAAVHGPPGSEQRLAPGGVAADLVVDTFELLQARHDGDDREAMRGTIDRLARPARSPMAA